MGTSNFHGSLIKASIYLSVCLSALIANQSALSETTKTCAGPTTAGLGNKITITTTCDECGQTYFETVSGAECSEFGFLVVPCCCNFDPKSVCSCGLEPPPGMFCDDSDGAQKAKFSPGKKPPDDAQCEGPTSPNPNGWTLNAYPSVCYQNTVKGFCCNTQGKQPKYLSCSMPCPDGTICGTGGSCIPTPDPIVCEGQSEASPDGIYSVVLKSGGKVLAQYDNISTPGKCSLDSKSLGNQLCCIHKPNTQDSIQSCSAVCEKVVPGSCCVEGKCVKSGKCGDGILSTNEQCDDGNNISGDGCDAKCHIEGPFCGNIIVEPGEECDNGKLNDGKTPSGYFGGPSTICDANCKKVLPFCGDFDINSPEECDPPNGKTCSIQCKKLPTCGNTIIEPGEECDNGKLNNDGKTLCEYNGPPATICDANCKKVPNYCGNGIIEPGEECDNSGLNDGKTPHKGTICSDDCKKVPLCGNNVVEGTEQCEPPNTAICSAKCTKLPTCGNKALDPGEDCDDGNTQSGDGCDSTCHKEPQKPEPKCGDGIINQSTEECDPPDGKHCDTQCKKLPICGNGVIEAGEQCDDGNTADGDGCSALCLIPIPPPPPPPPITGDGTLKGNPTFLPPIIITPFSNKIPGVFSLPLWDKIINIMAGGCSTTTAADGSSWNTVSTNIVSTVNYASTCKDTGTLTGFVCVDNKLVNKTMPCPAGTTCKSGKCTK